jgi:VWFA-related protein
MRTLAKVSAILACCWSLGAAGQLAVPAQDTPQLSPPQSPPPVRSVKGSPARRITLDVVVTDKSGSPVTGLQQQDFTILDDKQPETIVSFHATDNTANPADQQAILVLDAVNTSYRSLGYLRQELEKFLQKSGNQLPVPMSLVVLTDKAIQMQPSPSRDPKVLLDYLKSNDTGLRISDRSQGFYGAADRQLISIPALQGIVTYEAKQPGRKLLIWLSPGWAILTGPNIELAKRDQEALFKSIVEMSTTMRQNRVVLYSVDPLGTADAGGGPTYYYQNFLKGVVSVNKTERGNLALQVIATQSGGRVLNSVNDISGSIASCLKDAQAYYTLAFDSAEPDEPNEYHNLQIKLEKSHLVARTRTGYYSQP